MSLEDLYQDVILDHFKHPRCREIVDQPTVQEQIRNPLCGDKIDISLKVEGDSISKICCAGSGCCISMASSSVMSELCQGRSVEEVRELIRKYRSLMDGSKQPEELPELGDARSFEGVRKFTARLKCALLGWEALERCVDKVKNT